LCHHLAILARSHALQQLFFYRKSLSILKPFPAAKISILTLLEPILSSTPTRRLPQVITVYIRIHASLFMQKNIKSFGGSLNKFISLLDSHISCATYRFLKQGYYIAISNCFLLLSYRLLDSVLSKARSLEDIVSTNET
jgi:Est1 DNA/RNA binding domain